MIQIDPNRAKGGPTYWCLLGVENLRQSNIMPYIIVSLAKNYRNNF